MGSSFDYDLTYDELAVPEEGKKGGVGSSFGCIYKEHNFDSGIWGVSSDPDNEFL